MSGDPYANYSRPGVELISFITCSSVTKTDGWSLMALTPIVASIFWSSSSSLSKTPSFSYLSSPSPSEVSLSSSCQGSSGYLSTLPSPQHHYATTLASLIN